MARLARSFSLAFLKLGLTSFGGPIAHFGYFRAEFVERRRWLNEAMFGDLVALAQFLPGPASSQTGFAIGVMRAGLRGGVAAWFGFTLPSAVLMLLFAAGAPDLAKTAWGAGVQHGLKLLAVAVIGQGVLGMARSLCPDRLRAAVAVLALAAAVVAPGSPGQIGAIFVGGLIGLVFCRGGVGGDATNFHEPLSRRCGLASLAIFGLLLGLSFRPAGLTLAGLADAFYRSGALVFGGGHVVLPLLHDAVVVPGFVSEPAFLAGYGAAQALPGPVFTVAAFLGAVAALPSSGWVNASVALVAIFLPGLLVLIGVLPFWRALRAAPWAQAAMAGLNAAVVGLLAAALYDPVWTDAVHQPRDFAVAVAAFVALVVGRVSVLAVVAFSAVAGAVLG